MTHRSAITLPWRIVTAVATLLAAGAAIAQEPPQPTFPTLPDDAPAGAGMMQPCLEELEGRIRCGRYRVFENRSERTGRTIDLAFVVADALDPDPDSAGAVTFFLGGPGAAPTPVGFYIIQGEPELREKRDLLLMDLRGTGNSARLDCDVPYPSGLSSRFDSIFPVDHIEACVAELSSRADLTQYTSEINIDDLEELRTWLNYPTLDLVGGSYGSREMQVYLRRHPSSVRTAHMTGVSPLFESEYLFHAKYLQQALDELVAECGRDARCADDYPELESTVADLLERVRTDPPEVTVDGATVRLGRGPFGYALRGLLYNQAGKLPSMLAQAEDGDWQAIADYYVERSGWVQAGSTAAGMHFSVICAEDVSLLDDDTIARETDGTFLGDFLIGAYADACEIWPYARLDPSFWSPVESDVPTLLVSGSRDPVTPASSAEAVAGHLPNSLHILVPGAGHGVYGPCIQSIQSRFVESASVDDLDVSCIESRPPTEFAPPSLGQGASP